MPFAIQLTHRNEITNRKELLGDMALIGQFTKLAQILGGDPSEISVARSGNALWLKVKDTDDQKGIALFHESHSGCDNVGGTLATNGGGEVASKAEGPVRAIGRKLESSCSYRAKLLRPGAYP